jgi:hypothetical protein
MLKKAKIIEGLNQVTSEMKNVDSIMTGSLEEIAKRIISTIPDDELDFITEKTASINKEAKLINSGDIVICVDNFGPIFKGRRYCVSSSDIPGFLCINEMSGESVGVFAVNRFVLDNNEQ